MPDPADILLVQLDTEAPPGLIEAVAEASGRHLTMIDARDETPLDVLGSAAALIVLGSAAVALDPGSPLVAVLRERVRQDQPVLALDTGAALLALACGGTVRAGGSHEFNYVDLTPTALTEADPVLRALGSGLPFMEWHDDAVDLPDEVAILAVCGRARSQAFRVGHRVYGLRFHPGATAEIIRRWTAIRSAASNNPAIRVRIGAETVRHQERAERFGRAVIEAWLALCRMDELAANDLRGSRRRPTRTAPA
ncbi:MAG: hypothetical protein H6852_02030 [Geminicoccaceae bacterium]|nr:hypothetical protein [Geminicoccaceae bacterium]